MDIIDIEYKLLKLCKNGFLTDDDKNFINAVFANKILNVDYDDNEFLLSSSFFGNSDMIKILKS